MRIVAGRLKGRAIVAPEGQGTRPTSDRARQAVFNILEHSSWAEALDGARGAIRENADAYGVMGATRVHRRSAVDLGVRPGSDGEAFDIAFLDPPYAKGLGEQCLARLIEGNWLKPGALVVFERGSDEPDIDTPGYDRLDARDYGAARVLFLKVA